MKGEFNQDCLKTGIKE